LAHGSPDEFIRAIGYFSGRLKSSASRVQPHYSGPTTYSSAIVIEIVDEDLHPVLAIPYMDIAMQKAPMG
jgi:hypothetical protein